MLSSPLPQREGFAYHDGRKDEGEANNKAEGEPLSVKKDAEHHAEHRFQAEEQRRLRGGNMRERHVLDAEGHNGGATCKGSAPVLRYFADLW